MNSVSLRYILILIIGAGMALFVTLSLFSGEANKIGGFFRYFAALGVLIALVRPTAGILLLIVSSGYLDMVKRFTMLELTVSEIDIASVLVFAPLLVAGMTLNVVGGWLFGPKTENTKLEIKLFMVCVVWAILSLIPVLSASGLRAAGNALNYCAYPFLLIQAPKLFSNPQFVKKCIVTLIITYIPVMGLAVYEGNYGYIGITMDYLLSGFSGEVRQLADARPGAMSTLSGPPPLSLMMSLIGVYLILPYTTTGKFSILRKGGFISGPLAILFFLAAYYTFARTGWAVGGIFIAIVVLLNMKKFFIYLGGISAATALTILYLSAGYLVETDAMHAWEDEIRSNDISDSNVQATTLGTFNGRLASMHQVVSNPEMWTPFGFKIAGKSVSNLEHPVHEFVGNLLVRVGYVPSVIFAIGGFFVMRKVININDRLPRGEQTNQFRILIALGLACWATAIQHGQTMFTFPINLLWAFAFAMANGIYIYMKRQQVIETADEVEPVPMKMDQRYVATN